ncbi:MAG: DUF2804 domain-containing protein [Deltaproteobacteria bacterium]|nr:DUF2804 domain-containing protein [Deltaproteobacteria bacterium]
MKATNLTPEFGVPTGTPEALPDRAARPVPERLVDTEGHPNTGAFRGVIRDLNTRDLRDPFRTGPAQWLREKRWNQINLVSPDIAAGIAVLDLKYLASAFCYVLDRRTNRLHEFARLAPFGLGLRFTGDPQRGAVRFRSRGIRIDLDHDVAAGERRLKLTSRTYRGAIDLSLRIADDGRGTTPINSVQGLPPYGLIYSHRSGPLGVSGQVMVDGRSRTLTQGDSYAMFHWLWALHPRDARWTWVSGAGRSADGQRVIGFNLTRGSDGLGEPENFLWFDGEPVAVGRVSFAMDLARKDGEWAVRSEDGRVRLTLRPDVVRQGQRDAIWAKVYFRQPIGRFSGTLVDPHGKTVEVRDLAGFASDQTAHW